MVEGQYAITSPIYLAVKGRPLESDPESARYFLDWIDAVQKAFAAEEERAAADGRALPDNVRQEVSERLTRARIVFQEKVEFLPK